MICYKIVVDVAPLFFFNVMTLNIFIGSTRKNHMI